MVSVRFQVSARWLRFVGLTGSLLVSGACRDSGADETSSGRGVAAGVSGVVAACEDFCDRCDGTARCDSECRESFDPSVVRDAFLSTLLACEACGVTPDDSTCARDAREATGPATEEGRAFCVQYESTLEPCLLDTDEGFDDCEDWTRQIADSSLTLFEPCFSYPDCGSLFECVQAIFRRERPGPYEPECSWYDSSCGEPEPEDPRNSCATANDYRCDGPNVCPAGTDTADCEINDVENRCAQAYNGACDEPGTCKPGTDTFDCDLEPSDNRCEHAYDGTCDEPKRCLVGTDSYDCAQVPDAGSEPEPTPGDGGVDGSIAADAAAGS